MSIVTKGIQAACLAGTLLVLQGCGRDEVLENQNLDTEFEPPPASQPNDPVQGNPQPEPLNQGAPVEQNSPGTPPPGATPQGN